MCIHDAFSVVIVMDNLEVFIELLNEHKNINYSECNCYRVSKCLIDFSIYKCIKNDSQIILKYLMTPERINKKLLFHNEPLFAAIKFNRYKVIKLLLKMGADVAIKDEYGRSPLTHAIIEGKNDICKLLIKYGAYPTNDKLNVKEYLQNMGILHKNSDKITTILLSHFYDSNSLFSQEYLPRDMMNLIIQKIKDEQLIKKFYKRLLSK